MTSARPSPGRDQQRRRLPPAAPPPGTFVSSDTHSLPAGGSQSGGRSSRNCGSKVGRAGLRSLYPRVETSATALVRAVGRVPEEVDVEALTSSSPPSIAISTLGRVAAGRRREAAARAARRARRGSRRCAAGRGGRAAAASRLDAAREGERVADAPSGPSRRAPGTPRRCTGSRGSAGRRRGRGRSPRSTRARARRAGAPSAGSWSGM